MAYGLANGHVTDEVTWPRRCYEAVRSAILATAWLLVMTVPVWAWEHCRMSPPGFLAECRTRRLNHASFVLLFCVVCFFWVVFSFSSLSVLDLSSVPYFPAYTSVNGTVYRNFVDVLLRIYSLTLEMLVVDQRSNWSCWQITECWCGSLRRMALLCM